MNKISGFYELYKEILPILEAAEEENLSMPPGSKNISDSFQKKTQEILTALGDLQKAFNKNDSEDLMPYAKSKEVLKELKRRGDILLKTVPNRIQKNSESSFPCSEVASIVGLVAFGFILWHLRDFSGCPFIKI